MNQPDVDDPGPGGRRPQNRARGRPRARSHEAIRNATIDMLREVGYPRLTFEGVAARAGASKATVYRWWPTKSALVIDAVYHRINIPPLKSVGDTRADIRMIIQASYDILVRSPLGGILPALAVDLLRDPEATDQLATYLQPRRDSVAAIIAAGVERGDLPTDVDARALSEIWSGTILYRALISQDPSNAIVDQLTALILDGVLPHHASPAHVSAILNE